jgi:hypothetical protein
VSSNILAVSKLLLAFGAMHRWPDSGTCQTRVGRSLKRCVHESEVVRIIFHKKPRYPSLVHTSVDSVPSSDKVVSHCHWRGTRLAVYLMLAKVHSLRGQEYVYMHHGCREKRGISPMPGAEGVCQRRLGKFLACSITFFIGPSCSTQPILFFIALSSPFPLTTSTTLHLHYGQRNVRIPSPAPYTTLISPCRKYYDLLETQPDASESDLKKAYRKK